MDSSKDELTQEIDQLAKAIGLKAELLEEKVTERVEQLRGTLEKTGNTMATVAKAVVPTLIIRSHPWIATGTALAGGFLLAHRLVANSRQYRRERDLNQVSGQVGPSHVPVAGSSFLQKHSGEVRLVRNLVLSALTRYAGKKLRTKLPQFSGEIQLAEQAVSALLR